MDIEKVACHRMTERWLDRHMHFHGEGAEILIEFDKTSKNPINIMCDYYDSGKHKCILNPHEEKECAYQRWKKFE